MRNSKQSLTSAFQEISGSINKNFILAGRVALGYHSLKLLS